MSDPTPTAERREQLLGLLAEKTVALLCAAQQRGLEAETAADMALLSDTVVKLARSARQSVALHGKLEKDRLRGEPEAAKAQAQVHAVAVKRRRLQLQRGVEEVLCADWDPEIEDGDEESYKLNRSLRERLEDLSEEEDFLDLDPDQLIARLCEDLAVEAARADAVLAPRKAAPPTPGPVPGLSPNGHAPSRPPPTPPKDTGTQYLSREPFVD